MQDYWHIPRASLVSSNSSAMSSASSSKSSNKSNSNPPTLAQRSIVSANSNATSAAVTAAAAAAVLAAAKRGSRSSQGSSDSNNSTRSAASGSLLLTAANLERFAEIHKKQERQHKMMLTEQLPSVHGNSTSSANYNANLTLANNNGNDNKDAVIPIDADPNLQYVRTKDLDTVSIASSMHFTMVNGEPGGAKKPKRGLCDRGRQVTVLIVSMSTIFLLLIMGMVYALEMRARDMPKS
ncbi:uncharacterized protein LOC6557933 isoform X2 [Drosophila grimshawi]|uniref:GH15219 n=2 Tax=Drosophila grimshawi TaxID=7222 RepID=B4IXG4_DROGR|nr:uncharacterized protein LOC6557933 isoform X2 [Drosophila grimshawi]XP_032595405.1 uncharacterized protein LOC6557933 isoform X2 [Drosophila grimshawi]EDV96401.1 GH15219 [Drosophila grimshawi]